ncbi:amidohydrolase [Sporomusa acidovorans]|uniref:Peptidase M20 domain-containing protein 2 n=1 Tax=Sporomusa acidovorans (strain ATCC 49682 / DSM 3132 / Mol) TaxID=1123286 RepID=A0ABZ3J9Z9_SPOA4|nr:amidohydrolase [Sporomusa acidovorans]OZC16102.1 p-aminobenzoyl-glutamate hydrolase subunit B [Sporomusa acidovorans DSM 3132]SDD86666.1 amidohydrolase [Sporomusa acidovorans]
MNKQALKEQVIAAIDAMAAELQAISLFLHSNPELGGQEIQAVRRLIQAAAGRGFSVRQNISGYETAFIAHKGMCGPKIAFLAEYDALPGLGHACGHNLIAAMSWGAAAAFSAVAGSRAVSYFIGCPAEETSGAKVAMAEAGVFDDLTAALIVHPADSNNIGGTSYATHPLKITFHGRPAHVASKTDKGINALDALVMFYQGIKPLRQTFTQETILAGIITQGGTAPNIVPEEAAAKFTIRALSADYLEETVLPAVRRLAEGVALATGTTVETVHYEPLFKELINDPQLMQLFQDNMSLLGETVTLLEPLDADGSTDVGNVSHRTPTIHPDLGIGCNLVAHTPAFAAATGSEYAQKRLLVGAKAMAMTAVDLLE